MFCKHQVTFSRKGHVGLVQNRTGINFRTRTKFTESILQLLNRPWYGRLQFHLHITVIHSSLCKVETAIRLLVHLCKKQSVHDKSLFLNRFSSLKSKALLGVRYFPVYPLLYIYIIVLKLN